MLYASVFGGSLADASSGHAAAVDGEGHAFVPELGAALDLCRKAGVERIGVLTQRQAQTPDG
jgi:hypothetical protein